MNDKKIYFTLINIRTEIKDLCDSGKSWDDMETVFDKYISRVIPKTIDEYKQELGLTYANYGDE